MDRHLGGVGQAGSRGSADDLRRAEDYVRQLPLEKQKVLGYPLWSPAHVYRLLRSANAAAAELACLRGIAAAEQSMLDTHWKSAWALSGASELP